MPSRANSAGTSQSLRANALTKPERPSNAPGAERDVLLVYLSGHGTRFTGEDEFYFWNWELDPTKGEMERTGLSLVEFAEIATAVPAEVVLIIDAWNPHLSPRECAAISAYFAATDAALT